MQDIDAITHKLDQIMHEIVELRKALVLLKKDAKERTNLAWADLMSLSEEITKLWQGPSAVDEIRSQREK